MGDPTLIGRAHQNHIGGKHLLVLNQANVTHDNLAPFYCLGLALPEDNCCFIRGCCGCSRVVGSPRTLGEDGSTLANH